MRSRAALVVVGLALLSSCRGVFDNPVDPLAPSYPGYPVVGSPEEIVTSSPADGATITPEDELELVVSKVLGATAYNVQVSLSETQFEEGLVFDLSGATNSFTLPGEALFGAELHWRARAAAGVEWGPWSPCCRFTLNQFGPELDRWQATTSFANGRVEHSSVVHNDCLYVIGGSSGTYRSDVQYAAINPDGTLGAWRTTTGFNTARSEHSSVVHNGFLYVIGGSAGTVWSDVQYALVSPDGTLGAWQTTTILTQARSAHNSVVENGYLYVIGPVNWYDVQYAPIDSDGTLGSWQATTSPTSARQEHSSVVHNGFLYVIGGGYGDALTDVEYAAISPDGTLGTWQATTSLGAARQQHASVVHNGFLYVIGGSSDGYLRDVQYAPINPDGTLGTWQPTTSLTKARPEHTSVVQGAFVYVIGGGGPGGYFSDVEYAAFRAQTPTGTPILPPPTLSPNGGVFAGSVVVTIHSPATEAALRYTTDNTTPTRTLATLLENDGTVTLTSSATLKCIAYVSDMAQSQVVSATFTVSP